MNKFKISVFMLSLVMAACSNDDEIVSENNSNKGITSIPAEIMQPGDTRVQIGGQPGDAIRPIMWRADNPETKQSEADVIYVYDSEGHGARFIYSESEDGTSGIFKKDENNKKSQVINDISSALCVTTGIARKSDLPESISSEFNFTNLIMYSRGAENAQMYGTMENGVLKFKPTTGILEVVIQNDSEMKAALDEKCAGKSHQFIINLKAFDKNGSEVKIGGGHGKIDPDTQTLSIIAGNKELNLMILEYDKINDNKYYFPIIPGEYSRFEILVQPSNVQQKSITEVLTIKAKPGTVMKVDKKLYTVKPTLKIL